MGTMQNTISGCTSQSRLDGEFFNKLSPQALKDLSAMTFASSYPAGMILFSRRTPLPASSSFSRARSAILNCQAVT